MNSFPDLFIITSVIDTGNKPWSYTNNRSYFTVKERFDQTINTIQSIRNICKNALILLVECSPLSEEMKKILQSNVDYFLFTYEREDVRSACLESNKKGHGEVKNLKEACQYIEENHISFRRLFKISGRYYLTEFFNSQNYNDTDRFTFKMYHSHQIGGTVLYSVPYSLFSTYRSILEECDLIYESGPPKSLESFLPYLCHPKIEIETLGVAGQIAVANSNGVSDLYIA